MLTRTLLLSALAAPWLTGCDTAPFIAAEPPNEAFIETAVEFLDGLQPLSIEEDKELCGFMGLSDLGEFIVTDPEAGDYESCDPGPIPVSFDVIASYHTHAAFSEAYLNEIPSVTDVEGDMETGVFGFISTPGGRVWLVDWRDGVSRQVCGRSCVTVDPNFVAGAGGAVRRVYTLPELAAAFR